MRKKLLATLLAFAMIAVVLGGCGQKVEEVSGNAVEGSTEETTPTSQEESALASDAESGAPTESTEETSTETGEEEFSKVVTWTFPEDYSKKGYTYKMVYANDPDMSLNYTHIEDVLNGEPLNFSWIGPTVLGEMVDSSPNGNILILDKERNYCLQYWLASEDMEGESLIADYDKETLFDVVCPYTATDYFDTYVDDEMECVIWSVKESNGSEYPILGYECLVLDKPTRACHAFVMYSYPDNYNDEIALKLVESIAIDHPEGR